MDTIELIEDVCLFGGTVPIERISEVRAFLDKAQALQFHKTNVSGSELLKICDNCNKEYKIDFVVGTHASVCLHQNCPNCNEVNDVWLKLIHCH